MTSLFHNCLRVSAWGTRRVSAEACRLLCVVQRPLPAMLRVHDTLFLSFLLQIPQEFITQYENSTWYLHYSIYTHLWNRVALGIGAPFDFAQDDTARRRVSQAGCNALSGVFYLLCIAKRLLRSSMTWWLRCQSGSGCTKLLHPRFKYA